MFDYLLHYLKITFSKLQENQWLKSETFFLLVVPANEFDVVFI